MAAWQGLDSQLEHKVEAIHKFSMCAGCPHVLVRWTGLDASGDTWEPLEKLTNCEDAIRAFEQARGLVLPRAPPPPPSHRGTGMHAAELRLRFPLLGIPWTRALVTSVQPWWAGAVCTGGRPTADNLEPSRVSAYLPPPAFKVHVVAYTWKTSALRGTVDTLLDPTSCGRRWVLLSPLAPAGVKRVPRRNRELVSDARPRD